MSAKQPIKKLATAHQAVVISPRWQILYVGITVISQLVFIAAIFWSSLRYNHNTSGGTWLFETVEFTYPILFALAAYLHVRTRIRGYLAQSFWSVFIASLGVFTYYGLQIPLNYLLQAFHAYPSGPNEHFSWLTTYGITWLPLGTVFIIYCAALIVLSRRKKQ